MIRQPDPEPPADWHRRQAIRHLTLARWYSHGPGAPNTARDEREAAAAERAVDAHLAAGGGLADAVARLTAALDDAHRHLSRGEWQAARGLVADTVRATGASP